jgi:hypothetical protein
MAWIIDSERNGILVNALLSLKLLEEVANLIGINGLWNITPGATKASSDGVAEKAGSRTGYNVRIDETVPLDGLSHRSRGDLQ